MWRCGLAQIRSPSSCPRLLGATIPSASPTALVNLTPALEALAFLIGVLIVMMSRVVANH
jgi:hypothetical protein